MSVVVLRADARCLPLPDASVDLIVTSPPYFGLRSYTDGGEHYGGQIGSEATPQEWLAALVACTAEWVRVLKPSGSLFVNLGDKFATADHPMNNGVTKDGQRRTVQVERPGLDYGGTRTKSLLGLPWRYAIAATDQLGLILRRDIIWSKPNGLPESVTDRCRSSHEYVFHLVKQPRYYAAVDEIREPQTGHAGNDLKQSRSGTSLVAHRALARDTSLFNPLGKLPGSVWDIPSQPLAVPARLGIDHFAAFPMELPRRCILGWSPPGVCTGCGEGRRPVVDRTLAVNHVQANAYRQGKSNGQARWDVPVGADRVVGSTSATITGYACACPQPDAPTRPAVVLDPFGGTGTTALVAAMHGRTGISIDRSADYSRLAQWRTTDPAQRAAAMGVPKPPPVPDGMEPLFTTP